jgi:hypothetical protein
MSRLTIVAMLLTACSTSLPGESIATYAVTWRLEENTCGATGLPLPDGHRRPVELRAEGMRGYWRFPSTAPISGRYDQSEFQFSSASILELGSVDAGTSGCLVRRDELLRGRVDIVERDGGVADASAGDGGEAEPRLEDEETSLSGEHRISFTPDPGGRCANHAGPLNVFERLPCSALYRLSGVERKSF